MYPRNATSPEPIAIGQVVQISDGAIQTSGVTVRIKPVGVAEANGAGTTAYSTDGVVLYTPTQAETNYTSFVLIASKAGCFAASQTVITSASNTPGYAGVDWSKIGNATSTVALTNTTISTSQVVASVAAAVTVGTNNDKTGYSLTQAFPANFATLGINASGHVSRVTLVDTTTTNTDMRGTDNAMLAASYTAPDNAGIGTLLTRMTASRALYLDNLNVGGPVASQSDINALNQSASRRLILTTLQQLERPESGSTSYQIEARTFDGDGAAVNADSTPTLTATGILSGSLAGNLSSATNPATGVYRWTYSVSNTATQEQIRFDLSAVLSASTFTIAAFSSVVDLVSATWTSTDATRLAAIYNKLPSRAYLTGATSSTGALVAGDILNQSPAGGWTNGSFGDRLLVGANNNREVFVTGSQHVAADVHAFQPDVITSAATDASFVAEIQFGLALASDLSNVQTDVDDIQSRIPAALVNGRIDASVGEMQTDTLTADALAADAVSEIQSGLSTLTGPDVRAEVMDVLTSEVFAELSAIPGANSTILERISLLFMLARNKMTQTSTLQTLFADDGTTAIGTASVSDNGTTFTKGELG